MSNLPLGILYATLYEQDAINVKAMDAISDRVNRAIAVGDIHHATASDILSIILTAAEDRYKLSQDVKA